MNQICTFLSKWGFPLLVGAIYWIFDSSIDFFNPGEGPKSWLESVFPPIFSVSTLLRGVMAGICLFGAKQFEKIMSQLHRLEEQMYLNEYAVEHTKAFALLWTNDKGKIVKVNDYAADRLGYTKEELLHRTVFDITAECDFNVWTTMTSKLKKQGNLTYLIKQRRKDGKVIDAVMYLQYLKINNDQYQFAFICDAFYSPVPGSKLENLAIPSLSQLKTA